MSPRIFVIAAVLLIGCSDTSSDSSDPAPKAAEVRMARRAFDGAPPVIPHPPLSGTCSFCHTPDGGRVVPDVGIAPANPHTQTPGMSADSRCRQCHVFKASDGEFKSSEFDGFFTSLDAERRAHPEAPPVIPHGEFMREDCRACHTGNAARPEITCRHADRDRCRQCHVHQQPAAEPFQPGD